MQENYKKGGRFLLLPESDSPQRQFSMAILPVADRLEVSASFMRANIESLGVTKADLQAACYAMDDWLNANALSLNNAIPQPARSALSAAQKARLLMLVVERRFLKGV